MTALLRATRADDGENDDGDDEEVDARPLETLPAAWADAANPQPLLLVPAAPSCCLLLGSPLLAPTLLTTPSPPSPVAQYQYNFSSAAGITTVTTQTETDYWSVPPTGWAMVMESAQVQQYGSGWYK